MLTYNQTKMNTRIVIIACFLGIFSNNLKAQGGNQDDDVNLGLRMGLGAYSFYGGELQNAVPTIGYFAGLYLHDDLKKGIYHYQAGLDIRFRGGNFSNPSKLDTAKNQAYSKISLVTIDLPLSLLVSLKPSERREAPFLVFGITPSYILRSVMYLGPDKIPYDHVVNPNNSHQNTWENLPLRPLEILTHIGYQQKMEDYGYSIGVNIGINNLNKNFFVQGVAPVTGTGKRISTFSIEAAFIF